MSLTRQTKANKRTETTEIKTRTEAALQTPRPTTKGSKIICHTRFPPLILLCSVTTRHIRVCTLSEGKNDLHARMHAGKATQPSHHSFERVKSTPTIKPALVTPASLSAPTNSSRLKTGKWRAQKRRERAQTTGSAPPGQNWRRVFRMATLNISRKKHVNDITTYIKRQSNCRSRMLSTAIVQCPETTIQKLWANSLATY